MNYFDEYVKNYDFNNPRINYKYFHSIRVMNNMELLAKSIKLSKEDIELAKLIGLLHDIGRFDEVKLYPYFRDNHISHGTYGADLLINKHLIKKFNASCENYNIIYESINNHDKFSISKNIKEKELLYSKLLRDADKLDILYSLGNKELKPILHQDNIPIDTKIKLSLLQHKCIEKIDNDTKNNHLAIVLGFIYDLNFPKSYQIIYKNNYLDKIYKRIEHPEYFKEIYEELKKHIERKVEEIC